MNLHIEVWSEWLLGNTLRRSHSLSALHTSFPPRTKARQIWELTLFFISKLLKLLTQVFWFLDSESTQQWVCQYRATFSLPRTKYHRVFPIRNEDSISNQWIHSPSVDFQWNNFVGLFKRRWDHWEKWRGRWFFSTWEQKKIYVSVPCYIPSQAHSNFSQRNTLVPSSIGIWDFSVWIKFRQSKCKVCICSIRKWTRHSQEPTW